MIKLAMKMGGLNPNVGCVVFDFKGNATSDAALIAAGLHCLEGNHSTIAAQKLKESYPQNKAYQKMSVTVYNAKSSDPAHRVMLRTIGGLSNVAKSKLWDMEQVLHTI